MEGSDICVREPEGISGGAHGSALQFVCGCKLLLYIAWQRHAREDGEGKGRAHPSPITSSSVGEKRSKLKSICKNKLVIDLMFSLNMPQNNPV